MNLLLDICPALQVKINLQGKMVDRGSTNLGVNQAGFTLHSAIYASRPDVKCIVHIHTAAGAAVRDTVCLVIVLNTDNDPFIFLCHMLFVWLQVSAMKCGLLPISPEALSLGEVAYHDYHGILVDEEECTLIQRNLGPNSKVTAEFHNISR